MANKKVIANFESDLIIQQLALSPDGKTFAVNVYHANSIRLINSETGDLLKTINFTYSGLGGLTFSHDSKALASLSEDGEIIVWDLATGKEIMKFLKGDYMMQRLSFSPDGKSLVASFIDYTYKVWDINTWKLQRVFQCEDTVFLFSPDGSKFATFGGGSHEPAVWDFYSGKKLFNLSAMQSINRTAIAFDPRGRYIAASVEYMISNCHNCVSVPITVDPITIYDANTGKSLHTLSSGATNLVFSPDGTKLASVSQDENSSEIIIWDMTQP